MERWFIAVTFGVLGCGMTTSKMSATGGAPGADPAVGARPGGAGGVPSAVTPPDPSRTRSWATCGTIASILWKEIDLLSVDESANLAGPLLGHPFGPDGDHLSDITALSMSADGRTLVSMGGVTLVWDVVSPFAESTAFYVGHARPEMPNVELSPDGEWLAISGDGIIILSRNGQRRAYLDFGGDWECWPADARFSPDGRWLTTSGVGPGLGVYRVADFRPATVDDPGPAIGRAATLPVSCSPTRPGSSAGGSTPHFAFTPASNRLITETGDEFNTDDWQLVVTGNGSSVPARGLRGGFEVGPRGERILSTCEVVENLPMCRPYGAPSPKLSADGRWLLAGGTLTHLASGFTQVLDPTGLVGIFAPNGDVIVAGNDNSLTRYCLLP